MPGVPRATYMPFPFQIVQGSSPYILIRVRIHQRHPHRSDELEGRGARPIRGWAGRAAAGKATRWSSTSPGLREETWFDRAGNFHSDALHVVERYTPVSPYHLMYEATIEDPKVYTRPWKISFPLYRRMEKNVQLLEFKCVPFTEEMLYGRFRKPGGEMK